MINEEINLKSVVSDLFLNTTTILLLLLRHPSIHLTEIVVLRAIVYFSMYTHIPKYALTLRGAFVVALVAGSRQ